MQRNRLEVKSKRQLTQSVWEMKLDGCPPMGPGQFVDLALDGLFLRRPIAACDWNDGELTLLFDVVGRGTAQMAAMTPGETVDVLTGLGNCFDIYAGCGKPLLVGGGIGVAPLYYLTKKLAADKSVTVIMGFNTAADIVYQPEFEALGAKVLVATEDGSAGVKGFVTDALAQADYDFIYACGPLPMYRALEACVTVDGQYSFEARMGCGTGICMGCSIKTVSGPKRVCKEGPVFDRKEVIW